MNPKTWTTAVLLMATTSALQAQGPSAPKPDRFATELQQLTKELGEKRQEVFQRYTKAPESQRMAVYNSGMTKIAKELGPKFLKLADKARGTPTGLRARMQHYNLANQPGSTPKDSLTLAEKIVQIEAKNPDMARAVAQFGYLRYSLHDADGMARLIKLLSGIESQSPFPGVKAAAMFERGQVLYAQNKKPEALALMKQIAEKYPTTTAANSAKSTIFELERLQIGMVAPEIEGTDENGQKITLSEYRGKVVVLDFWGFW